MSYKVNYNQAHLIIKVKKVFIKPIYLIAFVLGFNSLGKKYLLRYIDYVVLDLKNAKTAILVCNQSFLRELHGLDELTVNEDEIPDKIKSGENALKDIKSRLESLYELREDIVKEGVTL